MSRKFFLNIWALLKSLARDLRVCIHLSTLGELRGEGEKRDHGAELVENGESFDNEWDTVEGEEGSPKVNNCFFLCVFFYAINNCLNII